MDIPLSSDALDIAFHPASTSNLLATGLISGKVQLIDYSALPANTPTVSRQNSAEAQDEDSREILGSEDDEVDDFDEPSSPVPKGKARAKLYSKRWTIRPSNKSCRGVDFDLDGSSLFSLSKDGSIFQTDTESGSVVSQWKKAHEAAPSRLLPIEPHLLATGDDDGVVSLWDSRKSSSSPVRSYTHHFDWITAFLWCTHLAPPKAPKLSKEEQESRKIKEEKKRRKKDRRKGINSRDAGEDDEDRETMKRTSRERLVCTSGDGTLSVIDIRMGPSGVAVSEDQEDELLSIAPVKQESKLVVGTQLGILSLWAPTRGLLDHVDRIPGHPASVDSMCTLDHDTILTGSSDGLVRAVQILPHKLLGVVADHGGLPVERLVRKDNWLASIGHGAEIKLTDLSPLLEEGDDDDDDDEAEKEDENDPAADNEGNEQVGLQMQTPDDASSDEDDSDSEQEATKPAAKKSRLETILSQNEDQGGNDSFFADL